MSIVFLQSRDPLEKSLLDRLLETCDDINTPFLNSRAMAIYVSISRILLRRVSGSVQGLYENGHLIFANVLI